ncbi:MAG: hypothetical protein JO216_21275 [Hyphomicrobiales bacterium]|nr:hypothetical protein [Hyphomicrobiales bacterium]
MFWSTWSGGMLDGFDAGLYGFVLVAALTDLIVPALSGIGLLFAFLPVLGFFTNGVFALYTIWLPELFPSALRGLGSGFAFSAGRLLGAVGPSLVGLLVATVGGGYPRAIAIVSLIYVLGLPTIALARETSAEKLRA